MKIELFVLPEKTRKDFNEAFILTKEEWQMFHPDFVSRISSSYDDWYDGAYLWEKMSMPTVTFKDALDLLRAREGSVLFTSEYEMSGNDGALYLHGREIHDFVAMADARELADRIEHEWLESWRWALEGGCLGDLILPDELYVFDTTFEWVIVFTHETDPDYDGKPEGADTRFCMAYGS